MSGFESVVGINPWTALFTFLNMIITFLLLRKFLFKPVKKLIDDRQKEVDDTYMAAEQAKNGAEAYKLEYQKHLDDAKLERDEILKNAQAVANKREQDIISEARAEAEHILLKAQSDIAQEKKKALNEIKGEISSIAMDIASKVVEKEIKAEDHAALIEEFIEKIGEAQ